MSKYHFMLTRRQFVTASGLLLPALMIRRSWPQQAVTSSWQLPVGSYLPANFPLQVIAPRAGLSVANRYYLAYPGLPLSLPVCVIGGAWPFLYELSGAPSGMTIGQQYGSANYGVITWSNPVAGTYNLTVIVTDQQNNSQSVSWTLTVQTANFIFVDSVNGNPSRANGGTGTGTISNPFKTVNDWYAGNSGGAGSSTETDATYTGYFVYYRGNNNNTYNLGECYYSSSSGQVLMNVNKPSVHLAYPGDASPTFDVNTDSISWFFPGNTKNIFIQGVTYNGAPRATQGDAANIRVDSGATDIVVTECTFQEPTIAPANHNNPAFLYSDNNYPLVTQFVSFVGNKIEGTNGYDAFLGYSTKYCLFESNVCNGITDGGAGGGVFYAKDKGNSYWSVRGNAGVTGNSGNLSTTNKPLVLISDYDAVNDIEIVWNNYATNGGAGVGLSLGDGGVVSAITLGRNTWQIAAHWQSGVATSGDEISVVDDVVQFTDSSANSHGWLLGTSPPTINTSKEGCVGLNGGFVDSSGNLQGSSLRYLGLCGHQISTTGVVPNPPNPVGVS